MIRKAILAIAAMLSSAPAFSATLIFSPPSQTITRACTVDLDARHLVDVKGLEIEISFMEQDTTRRLALRAFGRRGEALLERVQSALEGRPK